MASYHNRYFLKELSQKNLGLALPALKGVFSLAVNNFGYHLYNQTKADLGYAMKLGKNVSAGVKINWHNLVFIERLSGTAWNANPSTTIITQM